MSNVRHFLTLCIRNLEVRVLLDVSGHGSSEPLLVDAGNTPTDDNFQK